MFINRHLIKLKLNKPGAEDYVFLELTPPAYKHKTSLISQELFRALHSIVRPAGWTNRYVSRTGLSLELVSTRNMGVRYLLRASLADIDAIKQAITAYLPDIHIRQVKDYLPGLKLENNTSVLSYRLRHHFKHPLNDHTGLALEDPVAYLISTMSKLGSDELISLQVVLAPYLRSPKSFSVLSRSRHAQADGRANKLIYKSVLGFLLNSFESTLTTIGDTMSGSYLKRKPLQAPALVAISTTDRKESNLAENKLNQPLFLSNLRVLVSAPNSETLLKRIRSINSAVSIYNSNRYQAICLEKNGLTGLIKINQYNKFKDRLLSGHRLKHKLLTPAEVAAIYHFPSVNNRPAENMVVARSRTLPPSQSMMKSNEFDVLIGKNTFQGNSVPIGLTIEERTKHLYIVGGTGNGKSSLLEYAIAQDLRNGKGLALIDPHGDLAENILRQIPKKRWSEVIYFNPDDISRPLTLNLFELKPGLSADQLIREKELITESAVVVLRKLFGGEQSNGHRIEYILRNTIQTALTQEAPTLYTIYDLLTDYRFRAGVVAKLEDKQLKNFWLNEIGQAGSFQRVKMLAGITSKIGRFTFSNIATSVLAQPKSTLDFEDIIDSGKILICNISKGLIGEDTSAFFGSIIMAKLQIAAMKRARLNQKERRDFFLYVDEFQNFASQSFAQLLSEARKYRLFITMAEQSTSQQDQEGIIEVILANTGTVISFRTGNPVDERLLLPLFRPYLEPGDLANLDAYNFYVRIAGTETAEPVSGQTILMANKGSSAVSSEVKRLSRARYGRPHEVSNMPNSSSISKGSDQIIPKAYPVPQLR